MEQASLFNIFVFGFKVLRKPWQFDVLWFLVCKVHYLSLFATVTHITRGHKAKIQHRSFQAAPSRLQQWGWVTARGPCGRAFKEGKSDVVAYTLHCLELYWLLSLSKPTYFKTATATKTDWIPACLSSVIKQLSIFPFKTPIRNQILWLRSNAVSLIIPLLHISKACCLLLQEDRRW